MSAKEPENTRAGKGADQGAPPPRSRVHSLWPHFLAPVLVALILLCFYGCGD